jgi:hypothetical protein
MDNVQNYEVTFLSIVYAILRLEYSKDKQKQTRGSL